jgi:hypothetical protein
LLVSGVEATEKSLKYKNTSISKRPQIVLENDSIDVLRKTIKKLLAYRRISSDTDVHSELQLLERIVTFGLHILNDAIGIRPNYPAGDDDQPALPPPQTGLILNVLINRSIQSVR